MSTTIDRSDAKTLLNMPLASFLERIARTNNVPPPKAKPPATPAPSLGEPTPERKAKEPHGFTEQIVTAGTVYKAADVMRRVRAPLDIYADCFTPTELAIAEYFVSDAEAASVVHVTARYDGMPRVDGGMRYGGVDDKKRARYTRFMQVMDALPIEMQSVLAHLVLCVRHEANGKPATIQVVGRALCGAKGEEVARGVGIGYLKAALAMLHSAYRAREEVARWR